MAGLIHLKEEEMMTRSQQTVTDSLPNEALAKNRAAEVSVHLRPPCQDKGNSNYFTKQETKAEMTEVRTYV